jgi:hypothetical protein
MDGRTDGCISIIKAHLSLWFRGDKINVRETEGEIKNG